MAITLLSFIFCLGGCALSSTDSPTTTTDSRNEQSMTVYTFTDDLNHDVSVEVGLQRVVSLYGSYTEVFDLAQAPFVGVTEDLLPDYPDAVSIGSHRTPNVELIISLEPDFVILNPNISEQIELATVLNEANIPHAFFDVETFDNYLDMLFIATTLTEQPDVYQTHGLDVQAQISDILASSQLANSETILLLRAFSTNVKVRDNQNMTGLMLEAFNTTNLTTKYPSLLEDLSAEIIVTEDPDYIFITTMGSDTEAAMQQVKDMILNNPAYASLTAIQEDKVFVLPQDLFHYKPNHRWAEAYAYLSEIFNTH